MTTTLVDSNVLLDVATSDPVWKDWSEQALAGAADEGALAINPVIYAEVSVGFDSIEGMEAAFPAEVYGRHPLPWEAAFLAGKCFQRYRRRGGIRRSPLPDFYIGAHAAVAGLVLLTRDASRYRMYFPKLHIITPARPS